MIAVSLCFALCALSLACALTDFSLVPERGNYTCDELVRWLSTEKHYSNDKKKELFAMLVGKDCSKQPNVVLHGVKFGTVDQKKTFFTGSKQCSATDELAVAYLSNYSINNNFSHFLHGLLRLFCALMDARVIVWRPEQHDFIVTRNYTLWLDEYFKLSPEKEIWLRSFGGTLRSMKSLPQNDCVEAKTLIYGSGCARLLPPEKWFGYPGCRSKEVLRAFGAYMRQRYMAVGGDSLRFIDNLDRRRDATAYGLRVAFAVRDVGATTGMRQVSNLAQVQHLLRRTQHIQSSMENVTFEHLDVASTIRYMAGVHIFVSVHGAGMTNMFFMHPGSAVVEIIPYPLCQCRSPDYFYGVGGYYHGSAVAGGIRHYPFCVAEQDVHWHEVPKELRVGGSGGSAKCSWKHLHSVAAVRVEPSRFVSLLRSVERDLVAAGTVLLTKPIVAVSPHANG